MAKKGTNILLCYGGRANGESTPTEFYLTGVNNNVRVVDLRLNGII
jgi:hypothetical protein